MIESMFQLSKQQTKKVSDILSEMLPNDKNELLEAAVWTQFATRYEIIFLQFYEDDRYSVRDKNGIEINGNDLDKKLNLIISEISQSKNHIPRAKKTENCTSFNTVNPEPAPADVLALFKSDKVSLEAKKNWATLDMQRAYGDSETMSIEMFFGIVERLRVKVKAYEMVYSEMLKIRNKKMGAELHSVHRSAEAKTNKKPKIRKKNGVVVVKQSELSRVQLMMKKMGRSEKEYLDPIAVMKFEQRYIEMTGESIPVEQKFNIKKTSSSTQTFGEKL